MVKWFHIFFLIMPMIADYVRLSVIKCRTKQILPGSYFGDRNTSESSGFTHVRHGTWNLCVLN